MKTPNTKIQAPKKSQCPNSNFSSDVGGFELEHWSFSGVWSLVFGVWLLGRSHSYDGLHIRMFAGQYPDKVLGFSLRGLPEAREGSRATPGRSEADLVKQHAAAIGRPREPPFVFPHALGL
jgi:hypothetical protein